MLHGKFGKTYFSEIGVTVLALIVGSWCDKLSIQDHSISDIKVQLLYVSKIYWRCALLNVFWNKSLKWSNCDLTLLY